MAPPDIPVKPENQAVYSSTDSSFYKCLSRNEKICSSSRKAKIITGGIHIWYFEDYSFRLTPKSGKLAIYGWHLLERWCCFRPLERAAG